MKPIVISTTTLILLSGGTALAALSGTPLDTVTAQVMTMPFGSTDSLPRGLPQT